MSFLSNSFLINATDLIFCAHASRRHRHGLNTAISEAKEREIARSKIFLSKIGLATRANTYNCVIRLKRERSSSLARCPAFCALSRNHATAAHPTSMMCHSPPDIISSRIVVPARAHDDASSNSRRTSRSSRRAPQGSHGSPHLIHAFS